MFPYPDVLPGIQKLYNVYENLWNVDVTNYELGQNHLILPIVPEQLLNDICRGVNQILLQEPIVLKLYEKCIIIGDLHGHILDLFRVLKKFGPPPKTTYIILGDMVDRGDFSLETATLIFVLKALFPKNIYIIRGNHEFAAMFQYNGFSKQLEDIYGNHLVTYAFANAFSCLPFGIVLFDKIFCVHGGIGEGFTSISQLETIQRPVINYTSDPIISAVWSDPSPGVQEGFTPSSRGIGFFFGESEFNKFMESQNLKLLVRGHEPCDCGVQFIFGGRLATVFGASNYCNAMNNKSGVLHILDGGDKWTSTLFPPIKYISRNNAIFSESDGDNNYTISLSSKGIMKSQKQLPLLSKPTKIQPRRNSDNSPLLKRCNSAQRASLRLAATNKIVSSSTPDLVFRDDTPTRSPLVSLTDSFIVSPNARKMNCLHK